MCHDILSIVQLCIWHPILQESECPSRSYVQKQGCLVYSFRFGAGGANWRDNTGLLFSTNSHKVRVNPVPPVSPWLVLLCCYWVPFVPRLAHVKSLTKIVDVNRQGKLENCWRVPVNAAQCSSLARVLVHLKREWCSVVCKLVSCVVDVCQK